MSHTTFDSRLSAKLRGLAADKSHHKSHNEFENPWPSFVRRGFRELLGVFKEWDKDRSQPTDIPVATPDVEALHNPPPEEPLLTWLGHAAFLLQYSGVNVLTDPICSERCSPVQFAGPRRFTASALQVEQLPRIDIVIISHDHYDHLDYWTVRDLSAKFPDAKWFVPLRCKALVQRFGGKRVYELDWWEERIEWFQNQKVSSESSENESPDNGRRMRKRNDEPARASSGESSPRNRITTVRIVCTPCQHFSGRCLLDRMATLWATWSIIFYNGDDDPHPFRFFFGGDTGYRSIPHDFVDTPENRAKLPYCPAFKQVGDLMGPFDLACLPIGAYSPRYYMSPIHCDPADAVDVHCDIRSKLSIGMHWGTFTLTDEPVLEPPIRLAASVAQHGLSENSFVVVKHGETIKVPLPARTERSEPEAEAVSSDSESLGAVSPSSASSAEDRDECGIPEVSTCKDEVIDEAVRQGTPLNL